LYRGCGGWGRCQPIRLLPVGWEVPAEASPGCWSQRRTCWFGGVGRHVARVRTRLPEAVHIGQEEVPAGVPGNGARTLWAGLRRAVVRGPGRERGHEVDHGPVLLEHGGGGHRPVPRAAWRSEEHTSELQSRENLVCRLL